MPVALSPLSRTDVRPAARLLSRAFAQSPNFVVLWPDPRTRARALTSLFTAGVGDALRHGHVDGAWDGGKLVACASWLPAGRHHLGARRKLRALPHVLRAGLVSAAAVRRLAALESTIERLHPARPHRYLVVVGVEPAAHRRGIGATLLRPELEAADRAAEPCYLETPTRDNVRFYERLGFEVLDELPLFPGGPPNWTMWRSPRASPAKRAPR